MEVNDQECAISSKMEQDPCVWVGVCAYVEISISSLLFRGNKKNDNE